MPVLKSHLYICLTFLFSHFSKIIHDGHRSFTPLNGSPLSAWTSPQLLHFEKSGGGQLIGTSILSKASFEAFLLSSRYLLLLAIASTSELAGIQGFESKSGFPVKDLFLSCFFFFILQLPLLLDEVILIPKREVFYI